jgi:ligand-binding SRPBCC domain-containing protein
MFTLERETFVAAPRSQVFAFFSDPQNLARITPPSLGFEIVEAPSRPLRAGDRIHYRIRLLGLLRVPWISKITAWREGTYFVDEQERGPYRSWRHEHALHAAGRGVLMIDRVEYDLPLGTVGRLFGERWVRRNLREIFDYRAHAIREIFPDRGYRTAARRTTTSSGSFCGGASKLDGLPFKPSKNAMRRP